METESPSQPIVPAPVMMKCRFCDETYANPRALYKHLKTTHSSGPQAKGNLICPLCGIRSINYEAHRDHLLFCHGHKTEGEKLEYNSFTEFLLWKNKLEKDQHCKYFCQNVSKILSTKDKKYYYQCHRSGAFKYKSTGLTKSRMQSTCPSMISVVECHDSKTVKVEYWRTHLGHDLLPINKKVFVEKKNVRSAPADEDSEEDVYFDSNADEDNSGTENNSPSSRSILKNSLKRDENTPGDVVPAKKIKPARRTAKKQFLVNSNAKNSSASSLYNLASVACRKSSNAIDVSHNMGNVTPKSPLSTSVGVTSGTSVYLMQNSAATPKSLLSTTTTAATIASTIPLSIGSKIILTPKAPLSAIVNVPNSATANTAPSTITTVTCTDTKSSNSLSIPTPTSPTSTPAVGTVARTLIGNFSVRSSTPSSRGRRPCLPTPTSQNVRFSGRSVQPRNPMVMISPLPLVRAPPVMTQGTGKIGPGTLNRTPVIRSSTPRTPMYRPALGARSPLLSTNVVRPTVNPPNVTVPVVNTSISSIPLSSKLPATPHSITKSPSVAGTQAVVITQSLTKSSPLTPSRKPMCSILKSSTVEDTVPSINTVYYNTSSVISSSVAVNKPANDVTGSQSASISTIVLESPISSAPNITISDLPNSGTLLLQDDDDVYLLEPFDDADIASDSSEEEPEASDSNEEESEASDSNEEESEASDSNEEEPEAPEPTSAESEPIITVTSSFSAHDDIKDKSVKSLTYNTPESQSNKHEDSKSLKKIPLTTVTSSFTSANRDSTPARSLPYNMSESCNVSHEDCEVLKKIELYKMEMKYFASQEECKKLKIELMKANKKNEELMKENPECSNQSETKESSQNKNYIDHSQEPSEVELVPKNDSKVIQSNAEEPIEVDGGIDLLQEISNAEELIEVDGGIDLLQEQSNAEEPIEIDDSIDLLQKQSNAEEPIEIDDSIDILQKQSNAEEPTEIDDSIELLQKQLNAEEPIEIDDSTDLLQKTGKHEIAKDPVSEQQETIKALESKYGSDEDLDVYSLVRTSVLRNFHFELKELFEENKLLSEKIHSYKKRDYFYKLMQTRFSEEDF